MNDLTKEIPAAVFAEWQAERRGDRTRIETFEDVVLMFDETLVGVFLSKESLVSSICDIEELPDWVVESINWEVAVSVYIEHHEHIRIDHNGVIYLFLSS